MCGMSTLASDPTSFALATVEPTWKQALRVWWAFQWRVVVACFVLGFLIGGLAGIMLGILGASPVVFGYSLFTIRIVIYLAVTLYFIKDFLDRDFGSFRVGLVPKATPESSKAASAAQ